MLTILTAADGAPQTKKFTPDEQGGVKSTAPKFTSQFHVQTVEFSDLYGLAAALDGVQTHETIIPGVRNDQPSLKANGTVQTTKNEWAARGDRPEQIAFFKDDFVNWICFDLDDFPVPVGYGWHDPAGMASAVWGDLQRRHDFLRGVGCVWKTSGSAGMPGKDDTARFHLFVMLERALLEHDRRALLAAVPEADAGMWTCVKKHYVAGRVCDGFPDPLGNAQRSGVIDGAPLVWKPTMPPPARTATGPISITDETTPDARAELERLAARLGNTRLGGRSNAVGSIGRLAGGMVGAGEATEDDAFAILWNAITANFDHPDKHDDHLSMVIEDGADYPMTAAAIRAQYDDQRQNDLGKQFPDVGNAYMPAGARMTPPTHTTPLAMVKDHITTTLPDNVAPLAQDVARLPRAQREQVMEHADQHNPTITGPLRAAVQGEHDQLRMGTTQQLYADGAAKALADYVKIRDVGGGSAVKHRITAAEMTLQAFNTAYKDLPPVSVMRAEKRVDILATDYWWTHDQSTEVYEVCGFDPRYDGPHWNEYGQTVWNTFQPPAIAVQPGDVSLWHALIDLQIPDANDRALFHDYMARLAQCRGERIGYALGNIGPHGAGKSTAIEVARYLVEGKWGQQSGTYAVQTSAANLGTRFNGEMERALLVYVHEMEKPIAGAYGLQAERSAALKEAITSPTIAVERKGKDRYDAKAFFNVVVAANETALGSFHLEPTERRWMLVHWQYDKEAVKLALGGDFFERLYAWLQNGGMSMLAHFYGTLPLLPRAGRDAPKTTYWEGAVGASKSEVEIAIEDAIEDGDREGSRNGWVSAASVRVMLEQDDNVKRVPAGRTIGGILRGMGYRCVGKAKFLDQGRATALWTNTPGQHDTQKRALVHEIERFQAAQSNGASVMV